MTWSHWGQRRFFSCISYIEVLEFFFLLDRNIYIWLCSYPIFSFKFFVHFTWPHVYRRLECRQDKHLAYNCDISIWMNSMGEIQVLKGFSL